jgi:hypothetical protein
MMLQRVTFSTIIFEDLKRAGVRRKRLVFKHSKVAELAKRLTGNVETQIVDLYSRIKKIYAYVNMDVRISLTICVFHGPNELLLVV